MANPSKLKLAKFLCAASLGTYLEFFDVALYSFCASIIAKEFFPHGDPIIAALSTWGIFALSYLMRPVGAVFFGHFADTKGGKNSMLVSMTMMSAATIGIGLLPTYDKIGIYAPILLLLCRIVQSIAVSPEYNLPSVFMKNNNWFADKFGLASSISACVTGLGMMSASVVMSKTLALSTSETASLYWRAPFIISGFLVGTIGIYLRWNLDETLTEKPVRAPFFLIFKNQELDFIKGAIIAGYIGCISYSLFSFLIYQLQTVRELSTSSALSVLNAGAILPALFSLIAGYLSDKYQRSDLMLISALILGAIGSYLFFNIYTLDLYRIKMLTAILLAALGFFAGSFPGFLAELFDKDYRYTGSFLCYNIGMSWVGGITPVALIWLSKFDYYLPSCIVFLYSLLVVWIVYTQRSPYQFFRRIQQEN